MQTFGLLLAGSNGDVDVDPCDVEFIMSQLPCSRCEAVKALKEHSGINHALLALHAVYCEPDETWDESSSTSGVEKLGFLDLSDDAEVNELPNLSVEAEMDEMPDLSDDANVDDEVEDDDDVSFYLDLPAGDGLSPFHAAYPDREPENRLHLRIEGLPDLSDDAEVNEFPDLSIDADTDVMPDLYDDANVDDDDCVPRFSAMIGSEYKYDHHVLLCFSDRRTSINCYGGIPGSITYGSVRASV
jgi:hypothetical protein